MVKDNISSGRPAYRDNIDAGLIKFVSVNGIRTRYYEAGSGDSLVLIHGGQFGSLYSLDSWSLNVANLATQFRVYAFDKVGQGFSDNPEHEDDYVFQKVYDHTVAFLAALGIDNACIVGHSRGALLAVCLALDHPELVKKIIIVSSNTVAPENRNFPSRAFYEKLEQRLTDRIRREDVRIEPEAQSYYKEHVTESYVDRLYEIALLPKTWDAQQRMKIEGLEKRVWLPDINRWRRKVIDQIDENGLPVPTLVAWGVNDRSAPLPLAFELFDRISARTEQAQLHVLNRAGHYIFRDQPEAFNQLVKSFCSTRFEKVQS